MPDERGGRLVLRLPVTLGFYGFRTEDVLNFELPSTIGTLAIVPELLWESPRSETWWLGPFVGAGLGKDFEGGNVSLIFAGGLRSLAIFPRRHVDYRLGNRLVYSGYVTERMDFVDDFGIFETGVEARRGLGVSIGGRELDGALFGASYLYLVSPHIVRLAPDPIDLRTEWELGFTLGTVVPWEILGLRGPRLGLSYRFGTGRDAVRFVIGDAFPIDSPGGRGPAIQ